MAAAYRRVGDVQGDVMNANLGNASEAMTSYENALSLLDSALKKDPSHRLAISEQFTVYRRIGNLQDSRKEQQKAWSSFGKAETIAEAVLKGTPDDSRIALQLAEVYVASSNSRRGAGDWAAARTGYTRAREMLEKLYKTSPGDWETRLALASAYSGGGLCDARMGKFQEAPKHIGKR